MQRSIKRMTERFVTYLSLTDEERKSLREKRKHNEPYEPLNNKWLGIIPFLVRFVMKR